MKTRFASVVLLVLLVAGVAPAAAGPVRLTFAGEVISVLIPGFPTTVTGSFTYDDSTPDSASSTTFGNYVGAITSFALDFGGHSFVSTSPSDITVTTSPSAGTYVAFGGYMDFLGSFNGFSLRYFKIAAFGGPGDVTDSLSNVSGFSSGFGLPVPFQGDFYDPSFQPAVGYVTSVTPTSVPDPGSSLLLLCIGVAGLRAWRRRPQ